MANIKDNFPKTSCIYKITNVVTEKFYIGSALNMARRVREHKNCLKYNKHCNSHLQRSFNKYGEASFKFELLEMIEDVNYLLSREQYYLDTYMPHYNMQKVAGGSALGLKRTKETCERISKALIGKPLSQEHKDKMGKPIVQMDMQGNIINNFKSIKEAANLLGLGRTTINNCLGGWTKSSGGFIWKYKKDIDNG